MAGPGTGKTSLAVIAAFGCLALSIFLIAATIVLALIPVYTSTKDVTPNANALKSQEVTVTMDATGDASSGKRAAGDDSLCGYVGGSCDDNGKGKFRTQFRNKLPKKYVSDVSISQITFASVAQSTGRRKRHSLSKRGSCSSGAYKVILIIRLFILYQSSCFSACQTNIGPTLQSTLLTMDFSTFNFQGIGVYLNGALLGYPTIKVTAILYVSAIVPGTGSSIGEYNVPTVTTPLVASNTTTGMMGG